MGDLYVIGQWVIIGWVLLAMVAVVVVRPAEVDAAAAEHRRCEECKSHWFAEPGTDQGRIMRALSRRARHAAREAGEATPDWAVKQGWDRCPSCGSRRVRRSRRQE